MRPPSATWGTEAADLGRTNTMALKLTRVGDLVKGPEKRKPYRDAPLLGAVQAMILKKLDDLGEEQPTRPQSSGVQVPVPSIACIQTVSISDARGGNEPRSART